MIHQAVARRAIHLFSAAALCLGFVSASAEQLTSNQPALLSTDTALSSAWGDYNGDGLPDLAVAFSKEVRLFSNHAGRLLDAGVLIAPEAEMGDSGVKPASLAWGDFDGDGDLDLYIGTMTIPTPARFQLSRNYLFRNDGERGFTELARQAGVDVPGGDTRQVNWIDYDNDGDLDLFITQRWSFNRLFRNDGGTFRDVSWEVGLADPRRSVGACWFDMDQDGDLDLFLANQNGDSDALYRNDYGKFVDIAAQQKMDQTLRSMNEGGVGCSVGDFDNDGDFDLFVATYGRNLLYRNDGSGNFEEVSQRFGISGIGNSVGASWGDYDNDGLLDLYVAGYKRGRINAALWRNEGGQFQNVLREYSGPNASDHNVQWSDYDSDGDLDLSIAGNRSGHRVLENKQPRTRNNRSVEILVVSHSGSYTRAGAEVRILNRTGTLLGSRLVSTGDGYNSQSAVPIHFGVRDLESVIVEVTFLTNHGRVRQREVVHVKSNHNRVIIKER